MQWCNGYGMLLILILLVYVSLFYFKIVKPIFTRKFGHNLRRTDATTVKIYETRWKHDPRWISLLNSIMEFYFFYRLFRVSIVGVLLIAFTIFLVIDTSGSRDRLRSLLGIFVLFGIGYVFSANRSKVCMFWIKANRIERKISHFCGFSIFRSIGVQLYVALWCSFFWGYFAFVWQSVEKYFHVLVIKCPAFSNMLRPAQNLYMEINWSIKCMCLHFPCCQLYSSSVLLYQFYITTVPCNGLLKNWDGCYKYLWAQHYVKVLSLLEIYS